MKLVSVWNNVSGKNENLQAHWQNIFIIQKTEPELYSLSILLF